MAADVLAHADSGMCLQICTSQVWACTFTLTCFVFKWISWDVLTFTLTCFKIKFTSRGGVTHLSHPHYKMHARTHYVPSLMINSCCLYTNGFFCILKDSYFASLNQVDDGHWNDKSELVIVGASMECHYSITCAVSWWRRMKVSVPAKQHFTSKLV